MYKYLVLKRLHSVVGIIPIGAFLFFHLYTNATAFKGATIYDEHVRKIQEIPLLFLAELFFIGLPILFHALLGIYIIARGQTNIFKYPYTENIYFMLQRITGIIALIFIVYHVITTRFKFDVSGQSCFLAMQGELFKSSNVGGTLILTPNWKFYFYILGILSSCFHLGNGLWGFCINFGILQGEKVQKVSRYVFLAVGIVLAVFGMMSLYGFYRG